MFGINYIGSQWYGHISIYCYTHLQLEHLLHKTVLVMFSWPALYFDQLEIPLKVMLTAWTSGSKQIWIKSLKWGTAGLSSLTLWVPGGGQFWPPLEENGRYFFEHEKMFSTCWWVFKLNTLTLPRTVRFKIY